jgi:hypothetical protein
MQMPPNGVPNDYFNNDAYAPTTGYLRQPHVSEQPHTPEQPQACGQPDAYDPNHDPLDQNSFLAEQANVGPMRTSRNAELFSIPRGQRPQSFLSFPPSHTYNQQQPYSEVLVARVRTARQVETGSDVFRSQRCFSNVNQCCIIDSL